LFEIVFKGEAGGERLVQWEYCGTNKKGRNATFFSFST